jgi:hypothetical protein
MMLAMPLFEEFSIKKINIALPGFLSHVSIVMMARLVRPDRHGRAATATMITAQSRQFRTRPSASPSPYLALGADNAVALERDREKWNPVFP